MVSTVSTFPPTYRRAVANVMTTLTTQEDSNMRKLFHNLATTLRKHNISQRSFKGTALPPRGKRKDAAPAPHFNAGATFESQNSFQH